MQTVSISGFGGSYEWGCQRMLQLGIEFLKTRPDFDFKNAYKQFQNVTGIAISETSDAEALDAAIMDDPVIKENGATGAMHQAVVNHLRFIHENGHDKWLEELRPHREPGDFFEFDGTEESIPQGA